MLLLIAGLVLNSRQNGMYTQIPYSCFLCSIIRIKLIFNLLLLQFIVLDHLPSPLPKTILILSPLLPVINIRLFCECFSYKMVNHHSSQVFDLHIPLCLLVPSACCTIIVNVDSFDSFVCFFLLFSCVNWHSYSAAVLCVQHVNIDARIWRIIEKLQTRPKPDLTHRLDKAIRVIGPNRRCKAVHAWT